MSQTMVYNESTCSSCGGSHGTGRTGIVTNRDELRRLHTEHEGGDVHNSRGFQDRSRSIQEVGSHKPLGLPEPIDFSDHRLDAGVTNARATPPPMGHSGSRVINRNEGGASGLPEPLDFSDCRIDLGPTRVQNVQSDKRRTDSRVVNQLQNGALGLPEPPDFSANKIR